MQEGIVEAKNTKGFGLQTWKEPLSMEDVLVKKLIIVCEKKLRQ